MRKTLNTLTAVGSIVALLALAGVIGCNPPPEGDTTSQAVTVIIGPTGTPSASPSPGSNCPAITRVGVSAVLNGAFVQGWRVGEEPRLDATPLNGASPVPDACHGNSVQWTLAGTASCVLTGDTAWFIPGVRCSSPGSLNIQAVVAAPGGTGAASFTVNP